MSRIHEALLRADLEGTNLTHTKSVLVTKPFTPTAVPFPDFPLIDLDKVAWSPWNPSPANLPTLAERGEVIEQFRTFRSRIYEDHSQHRTKSILVSSGMAGEGKSFVAANLAVSLAKSKNQSVVLIDADMRRPTLHGLLGTSVADGLSEYLSGQAELQDVIQRDLRGKATRPGQFPLIPNLFFIPAGRPTENASEVLAGNRVRELMDNLAAKFDWIVIDSPPVLMFADAVDIARTVDAVLLVARGAKTSADAAQKSQEAFRASRILGFVLNAVKNPPDLGSYDSYYRPQ